MDKVLPSPVSHGYEEEYDAEEWSCQDDEASKQPLVGGVTVCVYHHVTDEPTTPGQWWGATRLNQPLRHLAPSNVLPDDEQHSNYTK